MTLLKSDNNPDAYKVDYNYPLEQKGITKRPIYEDFYSKEAKERVQHYRSVTMAALLLKTYSLCNPEMGEKIASKVVD